MEPYSDSLVLDERNTLHFDQFWPSPVPVRVGGVVLEMIFFFILVFFTFHVSLEALFYPW